MSTASRARNDRRWLWIAVVAAVLVIGVAAIVLSKGDSSSSSSNDTPSGGKQEVAKVVKVQGTPLPPFTGTGEDPAVGKASPTLTGENFDRGPVVAGGPSSAPQMLAFVAHWCPHCQAEVPRIVSLHDGGKLAGVQVTAIATGTFEPRGNYPPSAWLAREQWPYPVLVDTAKGTAAEAYGLQGYPLLVFIAPDGKVAGRWSGEMDEATLAQVIEALQQGKTLPLPTVPGASSNAG